MSAYRQQEGVGYGLVHPPEEAQRRTQWNFFYAAILGAALNGLLTMYRYLVNRSFDPGYVVVYVIRFFVGVLSGLIVGNLGSGLFKTQETLREVGPGVIALLGGYSAEAVKQIRDRLVEVLVSVVRGKDDAAKAQRIDVAKDVLAVAQSAAVNPATPAPVREQLDALLLKLRR
jgi:hypothetical protein